jgi:hypothetical protein
MELGSLSVYREVGITPESRGVELWSIQGQGSGSADL